MLNIGLGHTTTLPHPAADTSPYAAIQEDIGSFYSRKQKIVSGKITPDKKPSVYAEGGQDGNKSVEIQASKGQSGGAIKATGPINREGRASKLWHKFIRRKE